MIADLQYRVLFQENGFEDKVLAVFLNWDDAVEWADLGNGQLSAARRSAATYVAVKPDDEQEPCERCGKRCYATQLTQVWVPSVAENSTCEHWCLPCRNSGEKVETCDETLGGTPLD
jgi:hypothetical protein